MKQSITGTAWRCTDTNADEFRKIGIVIDGDLDTDHNGEDDIGIRYENGQLLYMKYRRFVLRHEQMNKPATQSTYYNIQKEFELIMRINDHLLPSDTIKRRDELWAAIKAK